MAVSYTHLDVYKRQLLTRAGMFNIDGRKNAPVNEAAVKVNLHVTRAFELFKNHFVHARTRVHECRRNDGQRAALLNVARRAEKSLRFVQRVRVHAAGKNLAGMRLHGVVAVSYTHLDVYKRQMMSAPFSFGSQPQNRPHD